MPRMIESTPGPWRVIPQFVDGIPSYRIETLSVTIALVYADGEDAPCGQPALDNARLIAAAPDLLGALTYILGAVQRECDRDGIDRDALVDAERWNDAVSIVNRTIEG